MNNTPDTATATAPAGLTFRLETFEWQVHQGLNEEAAGHWYHSYRCWTVTMRSGETGFPPGRQE